VVRKEVAIGGRDVEQNRSYSSRRVLGATRSVLEWKESSAGGKKSFIADTIREGSSVGGLILKDRSREGGGNTGKNAYPILRGFRQKRRVPSRYEQRRLEYG